MSMHHLQGQSGATRGKDILLGGSLLAKSPSTVDLETVRRNLGNQKGMGCPLILKALEGVAGTNDYIVKINIQSLKDSREYDRIIREVIAEVASEQSAEWAELERREHESEFYELKELRQLTELKSGLSNFKRALES